MSVIQVSDLHKSYGAVKAVNGVNFRVKPGEIYGLLGPNGAGKSTTIEILVGLRKRDSGSISVLGLDPQKEPEKVKIRIGVQLQSPAMYPRLTVLETLSLFGRFYREPLVPEEVIEMVGLQEKRKVQTRHLSGGQMHRLAIALAIIGNGEIVFLDEPTTGLDPQARRNLWDVILDLKKRGKAVFLTTHYMDEAERLCDWVAIIDQGRVIAEGVPEALINSHFRERAIEFQMPGAVSDEQLGTLKACARITKEDGHVTLYTEAVSDTLADLYQLGSRIGLAVPDVIVRQATLEDLFLKLTGRRIRE